MADGRGGVPSRGASQRDVAAVAGVSPQTVSRVLNGSERVLPATREKVLRAMEALGYVPNGAARALRYGRHGCLGLSSTDFSRTGEARTVQAVVDAAAERGFDTVLGQIGRPLDGMGSSEAFEIGYRSLLARTGLMVDGFVVQGIELGHPESLPTVPVPLVVASSRPGPLTSVGCGQVEGVRRAVEHLLELGHRTVHCVAGPESSLQAADRLCSWYQTLVDHGARVPEPVPGDWGSESGYRAADRLLADPELTAVFCVNDEMAAGLMSALHERGLRIPEDVSVVGFDDVMAERLWPRLTTVRQDFAEIGRRLIDELLRLIHGADAVGQDASGSSVAETTHLLVDSPLIIRDSSGPPPQD
ncbi:LacI family DNA-binding transcriptional regulator [Acidipropionibacterium jensenii]|uniref:LacI family DNA-binding transcriptional regulator n=1 Tax=Acidipropionibacterium jensenii TaxID=1749 RepID=UPI0026480BF9|nr:LacI family DNA-binding transcriptional regulator [Acidipropionibacterium jensenii]MDN5996865.1 LacI family transcriptional regulator [Acidipropionibacterium jensenii]